ncbi:MAG: hypothetical protein U0L05_06385 [Schaedlerella sp.]|nr:hypothetical protein [Schaedlerella sp.]
MYLRKDIDIAQFLSSVIKCQKAVFFYSNAGDSLNLNSILSQLVFQTELAKSDDWKDGKIRCLTDKDYELLKDYLCSEHPTK